MNNALKEIRPKQKKKLNDDFSHIFYDNFCIMMFSYKVHWQHVTEPNVICPQFEFIQNILFQMKISDLLVQV